MMRAGAKLCTHTSGSQQEVVASSGSENVWSIISDQSIVAVAGERIFDHGGRREGERAPFDDRAAPRARGEVDDHRVLNWRRVDGVGAAVAVGEGGKPRARDDAEIILRRIESATNVARTSEPTS